MRQRTPTACRPGSGTSTKCRVQISGDYSPTEVTVATSGESITAAMHAPDLDFARQVILTAPVDAALVPAQNTRLSLIRNGLHLTGHSDGTSLVVLPQQFSHCLRPKDRNVRLVRADLLLTGVIFSGDVDTEITFDYGLFPPWCLMSDIADVRTLALRSTCGGRT